MPQIRGLSVSVPTRVEFIDSRCTLAACCAANAMAMMSRGQGALIILLCDAQSVHEGRTSHCLPAAAWSGARPNGTRMSSGGVPSYCARPAPTGLKCPLAHTNLPLCTTYLQIVPRDVILNKRCALSAVPPVFLSLPLVDHCTVISAKATYSSSSRVSTDPHRSEL
jgi:hypothetical protein